MKSFNDIKKIFSPGTLPFDFKQLITSSNLRVLYFLSIVWVISLIPVTFIEIKFLNVTQLSFKFLFFTIVILFFIFLFTRKRIVPEAIKKNHIIIDTFFSFIILLLVTYLSGKYYIVFKNLSFYLVIILLTNGLLFQNAVRLIVINFISLIMLFIVLAFFNGFDNLLIVNFILTSSVTLLSVVISIRKFNTRYTLYLKEKIILKQNSELEKINSKLVEANYTLHSLSTIDELTKIPNRRKFNEVLEQEWKRAAREKTLIGLFMIDIDYFKRLNDEYGHQHGDECLAAVAAAINDSLLRPSDFVARYGGEEFSAILPQADLKGMSIIAKKICQKIESLEIENKNSPFKKITVSIGAASIIPLSNQTSDTLIKGADLALYEAKESGRNQFKIFNRS